MHRFFKGVNRAALVILPLTAAWLLFTVALIVWHGGRWAYTTPVIPWTLSAATPLPRISWALICLLAWHLLRRRHLGLPVRWKDLGGKTALLAASLSLSLVGAEWGFRRYLSYTQGFNSIEKFIEYEEGRAVRPRSTHPVSELITLSPNKRLIYEMRPDMDRAFGSIQVRSNSVGMRDHREFEKLPGDDELRIIGIGDSGIFGWDVPAHETYLSRLERSLNARADTAGGYQVLNLGVPGYNSQQQVELLNHRGLEYKPDIVVVGWCNNDYDPPFFMHEPRDFSRWKRSLVYAFLAKRKTFYELIKPSVLIYTDFRGRPVDPDILSGMGREGVKKSFSRLQELARKMQFEVLVFGPLDGEAAAICRELQLNCYNTYDHIGVEEYPEHYGVHHMHPAPEGHGVLALHLEKALDHYDLL